MAGFRKGSYDATKDVLINTVAEITGTANTKLIVEVREYNGSGVKVSAKRVGTRKDGSMWFGDLGRITPSEAGPLGTALLKASKLAENHAATHPKEKSETELKSGPVIDMQAAIAQAVAAAVAQALTADKLTRQTRKQRVKNSQPSLGANPSLPGSTSEAVGALVASL